MALPAGFLLTPADSARAVGDVYGISLLATLPLVAAAVAMLALRRAGGGARAVACRGAVVALLAIYAGHFLPVHWMVWIVPEGLAAPLIALGRVQLATTAYVSPDAQGMSDALMRGSWGAGAGAGAGAVRTLLALYWCGVAFVLLRMARGRWRLRRLASSATALESRRWRAQLAAAARAAGNGDGTIARIRLCASAAVPVPITWGGGSRAVIVLPPAAARWEPAQLHAALVHECSHLKHADTRFAVASQVMCALYWFHPGAWWLAGQLQRATELACDDRVLLSGVRPSDYAELLVRALAAPGAAARGLHAATALVHPAGVRGRLAAIVDTARVVRAPSRVVITGAVAVSALLAIPLGTVRVSPTRDVLTTLMRDGRWESRAYAVVRLAQRADSVEVARDAAAHDPSPEVRAWAHYALAQEGNSAASSGRAVRSVAPALDSRSAATDAPVAPPVFLH